MFGTQLTPKQWSAPAVGLVPVSVSTHVCHSTSFKPKCVEGKQLLRTCPQAGESEIQAI